MNGAFLDTWLTVPSESRSRSPLPIVSGHAETMRYRAFVGAYVEVYRNLHNGAWSIRTTGRARGGTPAAENARLGLIDLARPRVIGHTQAAVLQGAMFIVQASGRARAVAKGQRNVHAFVRGVLAMSPDFDEIGQGWQVIYSPFNGRGFHLRGGPDIHVAEFVRFTRGECTACGNLATN